MVGWPAAFSNAWGRLHADGGANLLTTEKECPPSTQSRRSDLRRPALEQRPAAIDLDQALHLTGAGVEIVLEHLNDRIDLTIFDIIAGQLQRARHDPRPVDTMFDLELPENAAHMRLRA